jgi:hypothetical protein
LEGGAGTQARPRSIACEHADVAFSPGDFADDTDFERAVLDRLGTHRVRFKPPDDWVYNLRGGRREIQVTVGSVLGGSGGEDLRSALRPLGFAAAYKTLDMLIEHVLRANGATAGRLTFQGKQNRVKQRQADLPVPLAANRDLWDRFARLYDALAEARHAATHRRAKAVGSGDLEIYDDQRRRIDQLDSGEIAAFAAAIHALADLVIDQSQDPRRINVVAWHLNSLDARHGFPVLPATDPDAARRLLRADLLPLGDDQWRLDLAAVRTAILSQPEPSLWDLELYADERAFIGRWEEIPDRETDSLDLDLAAPPSWLVERSLVY